jgi:hypothetical protein
VVHAHFNRWWVPAIIYKIYLFILGIVLNCAFYIHILMFMFMPCIVPVGHLRLHEERFFPFLMDGVDIDMKSYCLREVSKSAMLRYYPT